MVGFLIGLFIGMGLTAVVIFSAIKSKEINTKKKNQKIYREILDKFNSGQTKFISRINNTVQIDTNLLSDGVVHLMYFIDKREIAIFRGPECIYTSIYVDNDIMLKISKVIWEKYSMKINNVVQLANNIFDRDTFIAMTNGVPSTTGQISTGPSLDLDDILDKISKVGYDNLTEDEKAFLKNIK